MTSDDLDLEIELHAYVDGDLDEEAMARVEDYLSRNPKSAARVRDYIRQMDDLRRFARQEGSRDDSPAIHELGLKLARQLKPRTLPGWGRAMVACAVFAAGWLGHVVYLPLTEGPPYTNEIVQAHLLTSTDVNEVLPLSTDRIAKLFSRIGEAERVPDLRPLGLEPVGAQLLPSDEGIVLHIPYRDAAGRTVSYFLLHERDEAEVPRHILHREGVTMAYWQHERSRYAVAAPVPDDELSRIALSLDLAVSSRL